MGAGGPFLAIFALVWTLAIGFFDTIVGQSFYRQWRSSNYVTTVGQITHSEVVTSRGSKGSTNYQTVIRYNYTVDGHLFRGDRFRFSMSSSSRSSVYAAVAAFPVGREATVYYDQM